MTSPHAARSKRNLMLEDGARKPEFYCISTIEPTISTHLRNASGRIPLTRRLIIIGASHASW